MDGGGGENGGLLNPPSKCRCVWVLTGKKSTVVEIRPNLSNIYIIVINMKDEHFNVQNTSSAHMKVFDLLDPNTS